MKTGFRQFIKACWNKYPVCFLAFFWSFSLSAGVIFAAKISPCYFSLMRGAISGTVSIVGTILAAFLPLILSCFAIRFKASFLLFVLAVCKGFLYGFLLSSVYFSYGSAGWLVSSMFVLCQSVMNILLLWFWITHLKTSLSGLFRDGLLCMSCSLAAVVFDTLVISPFLSMIILYY